MTDVFFKSDGHKQRFMAIMEKLGRIYRDGKYDQEYCAALYILTSDTATWQKAQEYVDDEGIEIDAMLREVDFSSGYITLIKLAGNLFNSGQHIEPIDLLNLDPANFAVALTAIRLRRESLSAASLL